MTYTASFDGRELNQGTLGLSINSDKEIFPTSLKLTSAKTVYLQPLKMRGQRKGHVGTKSQASASVTLKEPLDLI